MNGIQVIAAKLLRLALLAAVTHVSVAWAALPAPPLMEGAHAVTLGENMRVNGIPTRIELFEIDKPLSEVLAFYRARFGRERVERTVLGWTVVARAEGDNFFTVRLRPSLQGTQGTTSVANLRKGLDAYGHSLGFNLPAGSKLISDIEMEDPGKKSRLLSLTNSLPVGTNVEYFRKALEDKGFRLDRELPGGQAASSGRSLWLSANGREAILVVAPISDGASVVINTVESIKGEK